MLLSLPPISSRFTRGDGFSYPRGDRQRTPISGFEINHIWRSRDHIQMRSLLRPSPQHLCAVHRHPGVPPSDVAGRWARVSIGNHLFPEAVPGLAPRGRLQPRAPPRRFGWQRAGFAGQSVARCPRAPRTLVHRDTSCRKLWLSAMPRNLFLRVCSN